MAEGYDRNGQPLWSVDTLRKEIILATELGFWSDVEFYKRLLSEQYGITEPTITCDYCKTEINPTIRYVNAGSYGRDFHIQCMYDMKGSDLMTIMDLDAKVMTWEDWEGAEKAPGFFRSHPTP